MSSDSGKVAGSHLRRDAYLYVRQSTMYQVIHNTESTRRQYDLKGRAVALGWRPSQVHVIDVDQGSSGASAADRAGFQQLVAEVSLGRAGIVLGLECSRLARDSADWQQLIKICAINGTLICDEDGLYDPADPNDRLLLGVKGQLSEFELHYLQARMRGGLLAKAARGELALRLPAGLCYDAAGNVTLDPDSGVRAAVTRLFTEFEATGSASGVVKAFAADQLTFPARDHTGPRAGELYWKPLRLDQVLDILHKSALCRRLLLWPPRPPLRRRHDQHHRQAARAVDHADPRRPRRLHHLGAVRGQPAAAGRQRRRPRRRPQGRTAPRRAGPAAGPGDLRQMRETDDRQLSQAVRRQPGARLHVPA